MVNFIGFVGLAGPFTGLPGEPLYLVGTFELTSFPSGCILQTKTSPPAKVPLKPFGVGQSLRISDIKAGASWSKYIGNM